MDNTDILTAHFRCGYVTIIGEPNVGKSTLMNALLDQKISIVTSKPQTTRHKILGIRSTADAQLIFLDTPGIITPKYLLQETMMHHAAAAIDDADLVIFMIDATHPGTRTPQTDDVAFVRLRGLQKPVYLVINKIDAVEKGELLPVIDAYAKAYAFAEIFPVSALKHEGTSELLETLIRHLPEHPPFYPLDIVSEHDERFFVGEIVREKVFLKCQEEIPYSTTVTVVEFKEREDTGGKGHSPKWFIRADVYVERESQKGIVIGRKGAMLKEIGRLARKDIEEFLQHPVYLELNVRVQKDWRGDEHSLERLGYVRKR